MDLLKRLLVGRQSRGNALPNSLLRSSSTEPPSSTSTQPNATFDDHVTTSRTYTSGADVQSTTSMTSSTFTTPTTSTSINSSFSSSRTQIIGSTVTQELVHSTASGTADKIIGSTVTQDLVHSTASGTADKNSSNSNTGTIVGSAIGAAVLVILAVGLMFWLRGRKKQIPDEPVISSFPPNMSSPPSDILPRTKQETASTGASQALHQPLIPQSLCDPYDPPLAPPPAYSSEVPPPLNPVFRGSLK